MTLFGKQILAREERDEQDVSEAFRSVADAIRGKSTYDSIGETSREEVRHEVELICRYYQVPVPSDIPEADELNTLIDYITGPSCMMRRRIHLEGLWWKNGDGAILAVSRDSGRVRALLPGRFPGYYYLDDKGRKVRINAANSQMFETEALCFYKPLPDGPVTRRQLIKLCFRNIKMSDMVMILLTALLITGVGILTPLATRLVFSQIIPTGRKSLVLSMALLLINSAIAVYLISVVKAGLLDRIRGRMENYVMNAVMGRTMHLPADFFSEKTAGGLSQSILAVKSLPAILVDAVLSPCITVLFSLIYIIQIARIAPSLAVPALVVFIVQVGIIIISIYQQINITRQEMEADVRSKGMIYAVLNGIQRIRLSGSENRILARWVKVYKDKVIQAYPTVFPCSLMRELVGAAALFGTLWVYETGAAHHISVAQFAAFLSAYGMITGSLTTLSETGNMLAHMRPVLDLAEPILQEIPETQTGKQMVGSLHGDIEISHVSFQYEADGPMILNDMNLKIAAGEYVAVVGASGCGKSTLMKILLGFETPQKGTIIYDGMTADEIDPASIRRSIGTVLQNGKLFAGDIYSNITISAPWLTLSDAWEAARMVGMADTIREMPMGMHTLISEGGDGLSGGQKQRLMIARAIAPKPKILLFDEATSALDNITQKTVSDSLEKLKCTRIVIAHRLSTIINCDRIVVMDQGKIIEDGTYRELMDKNGYFADLVSGQQI